MYEFCEWTKITRGPSLPTKVSQMVPQTDPYNYFPLKRSPKLSHNTWVFCRSQVDLVHCLTRALPSVLEILGKEQNKIIEGKRKRLLQMIRETNFSFCTQLNWRTLSYAVKLDQSLQSDRIYLFEPSENSWSDHSVELIKTKTKISWMDLHWKKKTKGRIHKIWTELEF